MSRHVSLGTILLACLVAGAPAAAQQPRATVPAEGSHAFRHVLNLHKLTAVEKVADLEQLDPSETLVVIFGDLEPLVKVARHTLGLERFWRQGGALLIATDRRDGFRPVQPGRLQELGVLIPGIGVRAGNSPAYQDDPLCPVVRDWGEPGHPIFRGLTRGVVTNNPSYVLGLQWEAAVPRVGLAHFSDGCHDERRQDVSRAPFVVGTSSTAEERGRVLVIAGHGTFMNSVMLQRDNDNFEFACNCIDWLTNGRQRKHVLFVEEGLVLTNLNVPMEQLPNLPPRVISLILRAVERANVPNQLMLENMGGENVGRERILRWLLGGLTVLLAFYGLYRLVRAHHRGEPAPPPVAARVAQGEAGAPVLFRRRLAVLAEGNYWEAARDLARQCFEGEGPRPEAPPRVQRGGRRLRRLVERLWRLAYGEAERVPARRLERLAAAAIEVRAALADGSLCFASEPDV